MAPAVELRSIPESKRKTLPNGDFAGPDQSYPIEKPADVAAAAKLVGKADNPDAVKRKIIAIAKRKGAAFIAQLPKAWRSETKAASRDLRRAPFVSFIELSPAEGDAPRTSWVQILRTGELYDPRYGDFTITAADLATMVENFTTGKFPVAPTRLPIDYNHGTSRPQSAEMGKAAGWITAVELRGHGEQLWCCVEWTIDAATMIEAKEYQGLSASFSFAYKNANGGDELGPTLFGAALTNVPVVHGMQAATLALTNRDARWLAEDEAAEAVFSFDEQRRRVQEALSAAFGVGTAYGMCGGCYLVDLYDGRAIYREYTSGGTGDLYQVGFDIAADGTVQFSGNPVEVVADYRPLGATDMAKTFTVKNAEGQDVVLSEDVVRDLAKTHAPAPAAGTVVDLAAFKALETKVTEQDAKILDLSTANLALIKERREAAATADVDALIRAGKATAAEKPALFELAVEKPDLFKKLAATRPVIVPIGTSTGSGSDASLTSAVDEALGLARVEQEKDKTLSNASALDRVFKTNPALYEKYKVETAVKV